MKVISFNLAGYRDWEKREQRIVDMLNSQDADFVLLQEARFDQSVAAFSQPVMLNNMLARPYKYTVSDITKYYSPSVGDAYREGLAVFSKLPIIQSETIALTKADDDKHTRCVQLIDFEGVNGVVKIANVHFSNNVHSVEQLDELMDLLQKRDEERYIAGDFNILSVDDVRQRVIDTYSLAYDHESYISFPGENRTLDHVLIPKRQQVLSVDVAGELSDHNAVICEIK